MTIATDTTFASVDARRSATPGDPAFAERRAKLNGCGLFDLARQPIAVAVEFRALVEQFQGI